MAKIIRCFQRIFGSGLTATGNTAVFGTPKTGTPVYSLVPSDIMAGTAWVNGWPDATVGNQSPYRQDMAGFMTVVTSQLAYLMQAGIAEYDATTVYYIGSICNSSGVLYVSLTDANTGNALSDTTNWRALVSTKSTAKAWCRWNRTSGIIDSFNVTSVTLNGSSQPVINLASGVVSNANYCVIANGLRSSSAPLQIYAMSRTTANFYLLGHYGSGADTISDFDITVFGS